MTPEILSRDVFPKLKTYLKQIFHLCSYFSRLINVELFQSQWLKSPIFSCLLSVQLLGSFWSCIPVWHLRLCPPDSVTLFPPFFCSQSGFHCSLCRACIGWIRPLVCSAAAFLEAREGKIKIFCDRSLHEYELLLDTCWEPCPVNEGPSSLSP